MEAPAAAASGDGRESAAPPPQRESRLTIVRVKRRRTEAAQETLSARPLSNACARFLSPVSAFPFQP
jgi:hypothetical protein